MSLALLPLQIYVDYLSFLKKSKSLNEITSLTLNVATFDCASLQPPNVFVCNRTQPSRIINLTLIRLSLTLYEV